MSNFFETFVAALAGITVFYLLEAIYYEVKARYLGKQYTDYMDYLEEERQP
jgi:hypothetical protein